MATSVWRALGALVATAAACGLTACNCRTCCGPAAPATAPTPASAPAVAAPGPAATARPAVWRRSPASRGGHRPSLVRYNAGAGGEEHYGYLSEEESRAYVSPYAARHSERSERHESRTYEETREHATLGDRDCARQDTDGRRLEGCPPLRRVADRGVRLPGSFFYDEGGVGPSLAPVNGGGGGGVVVVGGSASASASASVHVGVRVSVHGGGHGGGHGGHGCGCGGHH